MLRAQSRKYYFLSEEADEKGDMSQRCQDLQHQVGCVQIHVSQLVARGACLDWALASRPKVNLQRSISSEKIKTLARFLSGRDNKLLK